MTTLQTMYDGQANSPAAELTALLTAGATSATVDNGSILPAAPMPLVIGGDSANAETVLMTVKAGNVLTITRAQEGTTAREWPIGTKIQRLFTAGDLNVIHENISALNTGKQEAASSFPPSAHSASHASGGDDAIALGDIAVAGTDYLAPVASPTAGNFASLNEIGNLTDSGKKAADFADADHDHDSEYLAKDNTAEFVPSGDYQPATKKYVDDNGGGGPADIVSVTADKTLASTDAATYQNVSKPTAITITIPTVANGAPAVKSEIEFGRDGLGDVIFSAADSVTLQTPDGCKAIRRRYSQCGLKHISENVWRLGGDLGAAYSPPTYIGQSASVAAGIGSITVTVPSGYAANDLFLLLLEGYDGTPSTPANWTSINSGSSTKTYFRLCYKIASSSESSVSVADSGDSTRGCMLCFRGVDTSNPINASATSVDTSTQSLTLTGPVTTVDNCTIVACLGFWHADENNSDNFSGWQCNAMDAMVEILDNADATGTGGGIAAAYGIKMLSGDVGDINATGSNNRAAVGIVIALTPINPSV